MNIKLLDILKLLPAGMSVEISAKDALGTSYADIADVFVKTCTFHTDLVEHSEDMEYLEVVEKPEGITLRYNILGDEIVTGIRTDKIAEKNYIHIEVEEFNYLFDKWVSYASEGDYLH